MRRVMNANFKGLAATILLWLARAMVVGVFLLWGAFFVEHTQEWFIAPFPKHPPLKVCIGQAEHLLMLIGLLVSFRWPRVGAVWVALAAFAFFVDKTGALFPVFFGITLLPVLLLVWATMWQRRSCVGEVSPPVAR